MLSSLSTLNQVLPHSITTAPVGPTLYASGINFPGNISNAINANSYVHSSGSGGTAYLNGTYNVNCSSQEYNLTTAGVCWSVFNTAGNSNTGFWGTQYGGGFIGNTSNTLTGTAPFPFSAYTYVQNGSYNWGMSGEYVQIELPYWIKPTSFFVKARNYTGGGGRSLNRTPNSFIIYGSNDGSSWTSLYSITRASLGVASNLTTAGTTLSVSTSNSFKYFRFLITSIVGSGVSGNPQPSASLAYFSINGDSYSGAI